MARKTWITLLVSLSCLFNLTCQSPESLQSPTSTTLNSTATRQQPAFEPNRGQTDPVVDFYCRGEHHLFYLTASGSVMHLLEQQDLLEGTPFAMTLLDANPQSAARGRMPLGSTSNYIIGNDPEQWVREVPHYAQVEYKEVYRGIDLLYRFSDNRIEFDFIIEPGADPASIGLGFPDASQCRLDPEGNLLLSAGGHDLIYKAPVAWQKTDDGTKRVDVAFALLDNEVRFDVGTWDTGDTLIIDPKVVYATYLGGSRYEQGEGIAVDGQGCAYVTGSTNSLDFPVQSALQGTLTPSMFGNSSDVFVSKFTPDGSGLVYSTYIGGRWDDRAKAIAVDGQGNVYITGETASNDDSDTPDYEGFPVVNAYQDAPGNPNFLDAFITVLNSSGSDLIYSSYLGGRAYDDVATDIAVDANGYAYITGTNHSASFPTKNAFIADKPGFYFNAFAAKFDPTRSGEASLLYSTFLGGYSHDYGVGIAVDKQGCAYVVGTTNSDDYPVTSNPIRTGPNQEEDVFVTKLSADGRSAIYSTYIGGAGADFARGIAVDDNGSAYISVSGGRDGYPLTPGNYQPSPIIAVVSKLLPDGSGFDYSVPAPTRGRLALDDSGRVYIASYSYIIGLAGLTADGQDTLFTAGEDYKSNDIAIDPDYNIYTVSSTDEAWVTTANAVQPRLGGQRDAFVRKLKQNPKRDLEVTPNPVVFPLTLPGETSRETVRVSNPSDEDIEIQNLEVEPTTFFAIEDAPDLPLTLSGGEFVDFQVAYAYDGLAKRNNPSTAAGSGSLVIVSDAETPVLNVPLQTSGIIINVTGDASDYDLNDGICDTDPEEPGNQCTLRAAIENVNARQDDNVTTVYVRVPDQDNIVIRPTAPLPPVDYPIRFDVLASDRVLLDGSNAGRSDGLVIRSGYCLLKYFIIANWKGDGLYIEGGEYNYIEQCTFRDNDTGEREIIAGITIQNSAYNTIRQTVVYGNRIYGIGIYGESSVGTVIEDCSIGYTRTGSPGAKRQTIGVRILYGVETKIRNTIIGNHDNAGVLIWGASGTVVRNNLVKSNGGTGIDLGMSSTDTEIRGNKIGTDSQGVERASNQYGIRVRGGTTETHIHDNLVSGNNQVGIKLGQEHSFGSEVSDTRIENNIIGLDHTGKKPLKNKVGIEIEGNCKATTIESNTVSGNSHMGINIKSTGNRWNEILDNKIGTDTTGTQAIQGCDTGIRIDYSAGVVVMGNTISGHENEQIYITGSKTGNLHILNNRIGTDIHGGPVMADWENTHVVGIKGRSANMFCVGNTIAYNETGFILYITMDGYIRGCDIHHNGTGLDDRGSVLGIFMNDIYENEDGIRLSNRYHSDARKIIAANKIHDNYLTETGIHLTDANATVIGNSIYNDAGDGIVIDGAGTPTFHKNNIMNNAGFGLNHRGTAQTIDARDNWWGSASGPGSAGPGSGDKVSAGVNYADWRQTQTSLVAFAEDDTCLATIGYLFPVALYFQNWSTPNDEVTFKAKADRSWFYSTTEKTVSLDEDGGGRSQLLFMIPPGTPPGTLAHVEVSAVSHKDGSQDIAKFAVAAGSMALSTISLLPDSVVVMPGDTVTFAAEGYNQFSRSVDIDPQWTCTGGSIDGNGVFIAGMTTGTFTVTITDANTGQSEHAVVTIVEHTAVDATLGSTPETYQLAQNYPNPFNPGTHIRFSIPEQTRVTLEIYNVLGQKIRTLVDETRMPGQHSVHWTGVDEHHRAVPAGIYFYHIRTEHYRSSRKMLLLR